MARARTIYEKTGRLYNFPDSDKLRRLIMSFDPAIGYFKLSMKRRNTRALRQYFFGTKGLHQIPEDEEPMEFLLSKGWRLRLTYLAKPARRWDAIEEKMVCKAGDVIAEFMPPGAAAPKWRPEPEPEVVGEIAFADY